MNEDSPTPIQPDEAIVEKVPTVLEIQQVFFLTFLWIFLCELVISATTFPNGFRLFLLSVLLPLPALFLLAIKSFPILDTYRLRFPGWKHLLLAIPLGLSSAVLIDGFDRFWVHLTGIEPTVVTKMMEQLRTNDWFELNLILITAVFVAPITEEMLFRGVLQGTLEVRSNLNRAVLWTAVIFTILHFNFEQILSLWLLALLLSFVTWRVDSILPAILIHMIINGLSFYVLQYRYDGSLFDGYLSDKFVHPLWFIFAAFLWTVSALFYFRFQPDYAYSDEL